MSNKLFIIRGLPGSGKSTYAVQQNFMSNNNSNIFEADHFFDNPANLVDYRFDASLLQYAHTKCLGDTAYHLRWKGDAYVANTFTQWWEIEKYLLMAKALGCDTEIVLCTGGYDSIHGVPDDVLTKMAKRMHTNQYIFDKLKDDSGVTDIAVSLYIYTPEVDLKTNKMTYFKREKSVGYLEGKKKANG